MNWDVFVSHAFEDKEFARTLAESLSKKGLRVWFDEFELNVGDSLHRSIDLGLSKSRFGIVILSPSFFAKEWPQKELDALTARETQGRKIILPIWHLISVQEIRNYSPMLSDIFAIKSDVGIDIMVDQLFSKIKVNSPKSRRNKINLDEQLEVELNETKITLENKKIELHAVIEQADQILHTDELTLLPNRRYIIADLQRQVVFSDRYNAPLSISMLEVDNFKQINDTSGHLIGDDVLKTLASRLRKYIRVPDEIGRYSGEVFLLILPNSTQKIASELAERLCQEARSVPIISGNKSFHLTISVGIAQYKIHEEDWQKLFDRSDKALNKAKKNGGDRWVIFDS